MSAPCDCCTTPPCVPPEIECKSISATGSKAAPATPCGFFKTADGKYYSTITTTHSGGFSNDAGCGFPGSGAYSGTHSSSEVSTKAVVDGVCVTTTVYSGSSSYSRTCDGATATCSASRNSTTGAWTKTFTPAEGDPVTSPGECVAYSSTTGPVYSNEIAAEEAETTSALISRVVGLLPSWGETWTGTCSAFRNLSPDESSYSIRRFKWRLKHQPSGNCYLKVWLREVFTPEGGGAPTYTDLAPYEWSATGAPCVNDPAKASFDLDNLIYGVESEIQEPAEDGTVTVEIVKYSCVPGYNPAEGEPDGYPPMPEE